MLALCFSGTAVFMPGLSYKWAQVGSWKVPKAEIDALSTTVRKIVRLYWSMQRAFQLGFDDEMMKVLAERYPPHMLSKMQNGAIDALGAILDALPKPGKLCPQSTKARLEALVHFCADMDMFLSIGADQRHGVNEMLRRSYREPPRASKGGLAPLKPSSTTLQAGTHGTTQQRETSAGSGSLLHEKVSSCFSWPIEAVPQPVQSLGSPSKRCHVSRINPFTCIVGPCLQYCMLSSVSFDDEHDV